MLGVPEKTTLPAKNGWSTGLCVFAGCVVLWAGIWFVFARGRKSNKLAMLLLISRELTAFGSLSSSFLLDSAQSARACQQSIKLINPFLVVSYYWVFCFVLYWDTCIQPTSIWNVWHFTAISYQAVTMFIKCITFKIITFGQMFYIQCYAIVFV